MKKLILLVFCSFLLLSGCNKAEEKTEAAKYTSKEVQQILKENGYEIEAHDNALFISNKTYGSMITKGEKILSLVFTLSEDQAYFVRLNDNKLENVAYTGNGSECYFNLTTKKFDESSDTDCGNLAKDNSQKVKETFESIIGKMGLSQPDIIVFMNDYDTLYETYK